MYHSLETGTTLNSKYFCQMNLLFICVIQDREICIKFVGIVHEKCAKMDIAPKLKGHQWC